VDALGVEPEDFMKDAGTQGDPVSPDTDA
jgi:hypothetical protein